MMDKIESARIKWNYMLELKHISCVKENRYNWDILAKLVVFRVNIIICAIFSD